MKSKLRRALNEGSPIAMMLFFVAPWSGICARRLFPDEPDLDARVVQTLIVVGLVAWVLLGMLHVENESA